MVGVQNIAKDDVNAVHSKSSKRPIPRGHLQPAVVCYAADHGNLMAHRRQMLGHIVASRPAGSLGGAEELVYIRNFHRRDSRLRWATMVRHRAGLTLPPVNTDAVLLKLS